MAFKVLANPGQSNTNVLHIHKSNTGCCPEDLSICKYEITADPFVDFQSITTLVNEEEITVDFENVQDAKQDFVHGKVVDFQVPVTTLKEAKKAIRAALRCVDAGGQSSDCATKDFDTSETATAKTICIYSEVPVVKLTASDGREYEAIAKCDTIILCKYRSYIQSLESITLNGTTTPFNPTLVYGVDKIEDVENAIAFLLQPNESVTVTDNGMAFQIDLSVQNTTGKPYVNGNEAFFCGCSTVYIRRNLKIKDFPKSAGK